LVQENIGNKPKFMTLKNDLGRDGVRCFLFQQPSCPLNSREYLIETEKDRNIPLPSETVFQCKLQYPAGEDWHFAKACGEEEKVIELESMSQVLGIDGGSTKTEWARFEWNGAVLERREGGLLGPANYKHLTPDRLRALLAALPGDADHVGLFLAGCATPEEHRRLRDFAAERWPRAELVAGSDRMSALATAFRGADGIAVISGTGSAVHGCAGGRVEKAGGWGELLGDRGSAYDLAMQGLRLCLKTYDLERRVLPVAHSVLAQLGLNRFEDLVDWCRGATKTEVAKLAPAMFAHGGDADIAAILEAGAGGLAEYTLAVARRLETPHPQVRLLGGIFRNHPAYGELFCRRLHPFITRENIQVCHEPASLGAAWLAVHGKAEVRHKPDQAEKKTAALAETERAHPRSGRLDRMSVQELVRLFVEEEDEVAKAVASQQLQLAAAVELAARSLRSGGRLFYAGAGTSGRLGVLDASEIPPTFGVPAERVQGIMAGGAEALHRSIEGAEDRGDEARAAVLHRGVRAGDVLCGIAASGRTPFTLAALGAAREAGAGTILLTCNPARERGGARWDVEIDLPTGPELVTGSTRLKAGTATKLALNILSTCTMIRLGKVRGNRMVDLQATNVKLRDRAARIVGEEAGISYEQAQQELERDGWNVRQCLERLGGLGPVAGA
jgi:N-acetylmuramic acid 6-phosphate etherase